MKDDNADSTTGRELQSPVVYNAVVDNSRVTSSSNLDVLFMSNSELDQLEQVQQISSQSVIEKDGNDEVDLMTDVKTPIHKAAKFIYPIDSPIQQKFRTCADESGVDPQVTDSHKRPHVPCRVARLSASIKNAKMTDSTPRRLLKPSRSVVPRCVAFNDVILGKRKHCSPVRQSVIPPHFIDSTQLCENENPYVYQTSTPFNSLTNNRNFVDVPQVSPLCSLLKTKESIKQAQAPLKTDLLELMQQGDTVVSDTLKERKDDQHSIPFELDWDEFNIFTQLHPPDKLLHVVAGYNMVQREGQKHVEERERSKRKLLSEKVSTSSINAVVEHDVSANAAVMVVTEDGTKAEGCTHVSGGPGNSLTNLKSVGFTTASGKAINVSAESLSAMQKLISEDALHNAHLTSVGLLAKSNASPSTEVCVFHEDNLLAKKNTDNLLFSSAKMMHGDTSVILSDDNSQVWNIDDKFLQANVLCVSGSDFATANKQKISLESIEKHEDFPILMAGQQIDPSVKSVESIVEEASDKVHATVKDSKPVMSSTSCAIESTFKPFTLAVEPVLSLKKSHKSSFSLDFTTAGGKTVSVTEEALQAVKRLHSDELNSNGGKYVEELDESMLHSAKSSLSIGFATASGKPVYIAQKSLQAVRNLFYEDSKTFPIVDRGGDINGNTCKSFQRNSVDPALSVGKFRFGLNLTGKQGSSRSCGFTTASGKPVDVAEESLFAVKGLFSDDVSCTLIDHDTTCEEPLKALAKTNNDESCIEQPPLIGADMTGNVTKVRNQCLESHPIRFTTASGKPVSIEEGSLKVARGLLLEDVQPAHCTEFAFQEQCSYQAISPSNVVGPLEQAHEVTLKDNSRSFGFTASGNMISISNESLQTVRESHDKDLCGKPTGSVRVSQCPVVAVADERVLVKRAHLCPSSAANSFESIFFCIIIIKTLTGFSF